MSENRILFFCKFPPPYHGQTICTRKIYDVLSAEYAFNVFSIDTSYGKRRPDNVNARYVLFNIIYSFKLLGLYYRLIYNLVKFSPDVIYIVLSPSYMGIFRNYVTLILSRLFRCRIIVHIHNQSLTHNIEKKIFFRYLFNKLDKYIYKYISISKKITNSLSYFTNKNKIETIYNTIDNNLFITDDEIKNKITAKEHSNNYKFLFLSNIIEEKGVIYLLEAFSKISNSKENNIQLILIGECNDSRLSKLINKYLTEYTNITYEGAIYDRDKIRQILLETDVFVLPTYYQNEALPISIIESLNAGAPVISTNHASISELVEDGKNGFLIKKRSTEDLEEKIKSILDRKLWKKMAIEARKSYVDKFNQDIFEEKLVAVFSRK